MNMEAMIDKYFRPGRLPHIWCPGCGNGVVTGTIVKAVAKLDLDKDKVAIISGIGCSSRASGYLDFNTVHSAHGRALPVATGVKLADPGLTVIVVTGDGDATAVNIGESLDKKAPCLGDNCWIGPGAKLFGGITIGNGVMIGAGSVVNKSFTENNITIVGVPARKIKDTGDPYHRV